MTVAATVAQAVLEDLLTAERQARAVAERHAQHYRAVLLELAEAMAPDVIEAALQRGEEPANWAPGEWRAAKSALLQRALQHFGVQANDRLRRLETTVQRAQQRNRELAQANDHLRDKYQQALQKNAHLQRQLAQRSHSHADAHAGTDEDKDPLSARGTTTSPYPPRPTVPDTTPPGMQARTYQRDCCLLYLLGKTGRARRPWLLGGVASYLPSVKNGRAGSMSRLLGRLVKSGLVQQLTPSQTKAQILRLTPEGAALYRRLYGADPVASEATRLLQGHQPHGLEHAGMCLAAAQYLEEQGYHVQTAPPAVELPTGGRLEADLLMTHTETGAHCYVEVERGIGPAEKRTAKWRNHLDFQGALYIVTLTQEAAQELAAEVIAQGQPGSVYVTTIEALAHDARDLDALWLIKREIRP